MCPRFRKCLRGMKEKLQNFFFTSITPALGPYACWCVVVGVFTRAKNTVRLLVGARSLGVYIDHCQHHKISPWID